jgi:hypothetical protein
VTEPMRKEPAESDAVGQKSTMLTVQVLWRLMRGIQRRNKQRDRSSPISTSTFREAQRVRKYRLIRRY